MAVNETLERASTTITLDDAAEATDGETLVIAGKTYTFRATVGDLDGSVHIGATVADTVANLVAAINLDATLGETGSGAGTDYGTDMTVHPLIYATWVVATGVITLYCKVPGAIGNQLGVANGTASLTIGNATLENGAGDVPAFFEGLFDLNQINSELAAHLAQFSPSDNGQLDGVIGS